MLPLVTPPPPAPRSLVPHLLVCLLAVSCAGSNAVGPAQPAAPATSTPTAATAGAPAEAAGRPAPASPSTGCGRASKPAGALLAHAGKLETPYLLTLPTGYDSKTPVPLVFAFHGRTRSHTSLHDTDASQLAEKLGSQYAVAYVKSVGPGYDHPNEQRDNLQIFDSLYQELLASYCIDTEQVFALGHSSGGLFSELLACEREPVLRGIAAVAGARMRPECHSHSAALLIHGVRDAVVSPSRGHYARQQFLDANGCSSQNSPVGTAGCVRYAGCKPGLPVEWCEHDEPTYQNTNHGWPSFASAEIARFFASLGRAPHAAGSSLIKNESFDTGSEPWQVEFQGSAKGSTSSAHGALCVSLDQQSENPWDAQIQYSNLSLEPGRTYAIDARLWTSAPSDVRIKLGLSAAPYSEYWVQNVATSSAPQRIVDHIVLTDAAPGSLSLGFQFAGSFAHAAPLTLCIDEVSLTPVAGG